MLVLALESPLSPGSCALHDAGRVDQAPWCARARSSQPDHYVRLGHLREGRTRERCKGRSEFLLPAVAKMNALAGLGRT